MTHPAGGPKTEAGKEVARWNATRHGIRSPAPVVPGIERAEDWEEHSAGILESLNPEGHLETVLAERVALLSWRLHRVIRYETESIALYQEQAEDDLAWERRLANYLPSAAHPEHVRRDLENARARDRLLKRLPKLDADKRVSSLGAAAVLWRVMENTDRVVEGGEAPEDMVAEISIPGVPDGADWEDYGGWTAGTVRAGIEAIASATDEDPQELLEVATDGARAGTSPGQRKQQSVYRRICKG
jgi:hypothetical protein